MSKSLVKSTSVVISMTMISRVFGFIRDIVTATLFGAGAGLRLNFGFFIFRFDVAFPFRDPTKPAGQKWVITSPDIGKIIRYNIAVGYPF